MDQFPLVDKIKNFIKGTWAFLNLVAEPIFIFNELFDHIITLGLNCYLQ